MRIIGGEKRGAKLLTLEGSDTRPTLDWVRENLFNMLQFCVMDAVVLDLFSGSGAMGLEAASRGAKRVVLNDCNPKAVAVIRQNIQHLQLSTEIQIIQLDWRQCVKKLLQDGQKFDMIILDAPYANHYIQECVEDCQQLLAKDGVICVEHDDHTSFTKDVRRQKAYGKVRLTFIGERT